MGLTFSRQRLRKAGANVITIFLIIKCTMLLFVQIHKITPNLSEGAGLSSFSLSQIFFDELINNFHSEIVHDK
jgi:preprotein translocase subunit SecB